MLRRSLLLLFLLPSSLWAQAKSLDYGCPIRNQISIVCATPDTEALPSSPISTEAALTLKGTIAFENASVPMFDTSRPFGAKLDVPQISFSPVSIPKQKEEHFHWRPALGQSFEFLFIEHAYRMRTSYWDRWALRGPFFRDWFSTVAGVRFTKWDDGDPFLSNYVGHPLQASVTGFIQIQNDPRGRSLRISKSKEYWHSRLRAMAWAAAFSAQFEIGPISEASLGNLGKYEYLTDSGKMTNGTGLVDFVVTPVIGLGWIVAEDTLDRYVGEKLELKYNNLGSRILRGALTPGRTMANLLRFKKPWHREKRQE